MAAAKEGVLELPPAPPIIGRSAAIRQLLATVARLGRSDANVLLVGESGTGKELFARAIHSQGPRAHARFLAVNCGALTPSLAESELFGHVRGAFTGAHTSRPGWFASAHRGTLLLDEIGELPLELQPRLLRAIDQGEILPVGADAPIHVDVRLLAATHRNLRAEIRAGRFREDLFHRLNVLTLEIPPLRERREDIRPLVEHFAGQAISPAALAVLERHDWPGNVRELGNVVERALLLGGLGPRELAASLDHQRPRFADYAYRTLSLAELERMHIERVLEGCRGNRSDAARILGINRTTLWKKLRSPAR